MSTELHAQSFNSPKVEEIISSCSNGKSNNNNDNDDHTSNPSTSSNSNRGRRVLFGKTARRSFWTKTQRQILGFVLESWGLMMTDDGEEDDYVVVGVAADSADASLEGYTAGACDGDGS